MKICQVLASRGAGGLERHFVDLCNHLAEHHQVVAVAHPDFRERLSPRVIHEPLDLSGWRYNPVSLIKLAQCLRRHRPDIVHAQANKAAAMVGAVRYALGGAGLIATVHNIKRNNRVFQPFQRVIAVSRRTAAQFHRDRIDVVHNGIAAPAPARNRAGDSGQGASGPVVLSAGRLVPAKGFDLLLRAWTGIDARLLIAGEGPERPGLEGLVEELGLHGKARLLGHRSDIPALLAGADLVIIASRKEGFPYFLIESLFSRKVVISTRVPGADEALPGEFLVDTNDVGALHARINQVLGHMDEARRTFEPVWDAALEEFTVERMTKGTEEVYRRALAG
ncbi:MAG TPA: glycosyltransferase [Gammaproteobacteria bacterium]|nr:glycosyltransferase [Gammaproteobacteria bacterium]